MGIPKGGIAFFDSGIGGLTVLNECKKVLPNEVFYYYGDNKHAPYGNLSVKKIKKYVSRAFKRLQRLRVKAVVLACNTVTAVCVEELRAKYSFPIIGAEPAVLRAAKEGGEVFVLSTRATYESGRFQALLEKSALLFPGTKIKVFPCDHLAGEIEKYILTKGKDYTSFLPNGAPNSVVLGCTHYVYLAEQIGRFYSCPVFDGNQGIAMRLCNVLTENNAPKTRLDPFRPPEHKKCVFSLSKRRRKEEKGNDNGKRGSSVKKRRWLLIPLKEGGHGQIYFLGSGKKRCKSINKQTFV